MGIQIKVGRRDLPIGLPTLEQAQAVLVEAQGMATTAAVDAVAEAMPRIDAAISDAAGQAAVAAAEQAAPAIRDQVKADADRAEQAAVAVPALEEAITEERTERRDLIAPEQDEAYIHRFLARSPTVNRLRYLLGGFRTSDGAFEASKVVARSFGGIVSSRWVDRIKSSDGSTTLMAFDHRGRARFQPDEATLQYVADNLPPVEGLAADYPLVTTATATFYRPMGPIIGIHAYGQSWEARNGQGAPAQNDVNGRTITGQLLPRNVLTLHDTKGFLGWEGSTSRTAATGFVAAQETVPAIQTPTGAMAFRLAREATDQGRHLVILARSEARGETPIERLMPLDMAGASDGGPWAAWEGSIIAAHAIAQGLGLAYEVRFIPWTHGQSNIDDTYSAYHDKVTRLFDRMSARAMEITGQTVPPQFLVVQQPSSGAKGASDTFKVISDICRERLDCTLVAAGYGHDMIDVVHWNRWGAVEIGELRAIAADMHLRGLPWDAPHLANPRWSGRTITFDVIGAHDVIADESIASDRHQINGTYDAATGTYTGGIPVPHYGFEASLNGAAATIESVTVERRKITITLASDPASGTLQIRYAMTASARADGRSVNRGNIRADWSARSLLRPSRTLYRWLASDYFNFSI